MFYFDNLDGLGDQSIHWSLVVMRYLDTICKIWQPVGRRLIHEANEFIVVVCAYKSPARYVPFSIVSKSFP
jgi:hypothetical protein